MKEYIYIPYSHIYIYIYLFCSASTYWALFHAKIDWQTSYIYIYIYITKWTIGTSFSEYWRYFFQLKTNTYLVWLLNKMKLAFFAENFRQTTYRMKKRVNGKDMVMKCSVIYCQYTFRPQLTPRCSNHNLEILLIWDLNKNTSSWKFCFRYFCFFLFFSTALHVVGFSGYCEKYCDNCSNVSHVPDPT